jgi:hypothetical protein
VNLFAALPAALLATACGSGSNEPVKPADTGTVLARVGDETVTTDDLGPVFQVDGGSRKLDALVQRRLAIEAARRRGLLDQPGMQTALKSLRRIARDQEEELIRTALVNAIRREITVSDEDLRAHYETMKSKFVERQWEFRVMRFANDTEAREMDAQLGPGGRLDPAKSETLGPLAARQLPKIIIPAMRGFQKPGDRQVLPLEGRWSLVELAATGDGEPLPFETVKDVVEQNLRATRGQELVKAELDRVAQDKKVTVDQAALKAFIDKNNEAQPMPRPGPVEQVPPPGAAPVPPPAAAPTPPQEGQQ